MKKTFTIVFLFGYFFIAFAGKVDTLSQSIKVKAIKLTSKLSIDGKLTEGAYQFPASVNRFIQKNPSEGQPASEKTDVWVFYDDDAIYFCAKMYDAHPDSIISLLGRRDNIPSSDLFSVGIDPYYDKQTGYFFEINPLGAISDGTMYNDSWSDNSWNGIWDYAASIDNDGWSAEMKIPFSQLRFNASDSMKWGINFIRQIERRKEESYTIMVPKKESGFVSHFADLDGLEGIKNKPRIEVLPYIVQKAQSLVHDPNDPFYKNNKYKTTIGGDVKIGLGSNLSLDATINPDFGQVEVDPAVVNLSAFETYFEEKRPFFIEGNNLLNFGKGGVNNNWSFNFSSPSFVYSRRIGRSPQYYPDANGYIDQPNETRILGAAKITGKPAANFSLYGLTAITQRMSAQINDNGKTSQQEVEPFTSYSALRGLKEFNSGNQGLGFIFTSANRDLSDKNLASVLPKNSFVGGIDGWTYLDEDKTYAINGYLSGSYVNGSKDALIKLQEMPYRYFQRPDATYATLDSSRTSLAGSMGRFMLNKQKGNFYLNTAVGFITPGFECNDFGFQWKTNALNGHTVLGYRWYESDGVFRSKGIYTFAFANYNFEGKRDGEGYGSFINLELENYYGFQLQAFYFPETFYAGLTRGGPSSISPAGHSFYFYGYTDSRKAVTGSYNISYSGDEIGGKNYSVGTSIEVKVGSNLSFSFGPNVSYYLEKMQWVTKIEDQSYSSTFGNRYIFAELTQKTVSGDIRVNWTFTPVLSLQLFVQPLFSTGKYDAFKQLRKAGTKDFEIFGRDGSTINYLSADDQYEITPSGSVTPFYVSNPNFNYKSFKANMVLRWEFNPGSTLYFVWTHDKQDFRNPGVLQLNKDFSSLMDAPPNNIFLVKVSYWFDAAKW
ncbi:MAG: carbohydrate binding family 9 domain-containing protein [Ignavibacteriaceae bacterium]|jgi:hypothetical protein|nr:carbohydrate binding family 9 domain-containing protein [Ignavibacteriaceae bacterium]